MSTTNPTTKIPTTLNDAVRELMAASSPNLLFEAMSMGRETARSAAHHGLGLWIRNEWKLWVPGTPLREWFEKELGAQHPDDMSSIVIDALWADLNSQPRHTEKLLEEFRAHWEKWGDPHA